MKKFLTFCLLFFMITPLYSQQLAVELFKKLPNDLDARVNEPRKDQNGDVCAIIKVVTTETGFSFDSGQIGIVKTVQKPAEIWVYVPFGKEWFGYSTRRLKENPRMATHIIKALFIRG